MIDDNSEAPTEDGLDHGQAEDHLDGGLAGEMLDLAKAAYSNSTTYIDSNMRRVWETAHKHFNGEHGPDSRYRRSDYRSKSRRFYPKTRSVIRAGEASVAAALFSSKDLISCDPGDEDNPSQRLAAEIHQQLLQYRLEKTIPWFLTCVGAYQLASISGMCVSYNWWRFETVTETQYVELKDELGNPVIDEDGQPMLEARNVRRVVHDKPQIDLMPIENIRFSPDADWRDPLQESPYLIVDTPMSAGDVVRAMEDGEAFGLVAAWKSYPMATVIAHGARQDDQTRKAREGDKRTDPTQVNEGADNPFTTVWLRKVFIRKDGIDYLFWTIGDNLLLSEPVPTETVYFHGKRPYTFGIVNVEALKTYPAGTATVIASLQEETNEIRNQRRENIELALNKRFLIRRGEAVDIQALMRNVPGGGVAVDDTEKSIRELSFNDVTSSSYMEQDRIDLSIDEAAGHFSQASVMSNRAMNETVGGMKMLGDNAFALQDYAVRVFVETWVEKTLEQLRLLEAYYESDNVILHLAATKADAYNKLGIQDIGQLGAERLDWLLQQDVSVMVNVGMGATTPERRLQRFVTAVTTSMQLAPEEVARINGEEIRNEVFAIAGYKNGNRFRLDDAAFQKKMQEMQPQIPPEVQARLKEIEARAQADALEHKRSLMKMDIDRELGFAKLALQEGLTLKALEAKLAIDLRRDKTTRDVAALTNIARQQQTALGEREMAFKETTGQPGI